MGSKTNIGKTLYFSAALPATNTAEGFEALTWTKLEHVVQAPQFGVSHNNVDAPDLQSGWTQGIKGAGSGTDSQITARIEDGALTTAQLAFKAIADDADGHISIKVVRGSGTSQAPVAGDPVRYAQGYLHSYAENEITVDSYEGFSVNFKQNAATVISTEPA